MKARLATALAVGLIALAAPANADTLVTDFSNFVLDGGVYGSWGETSMSLTSGPDSFLVQGLGGFGGGSHDIDPNVDATGETAIEFIVNVGDLSDLPGAILALSDDDGTELNFAWYALPQGVNVLTRDLTDFNWQSAAGSVPGLDVSSISWMHIQIDPGPTNIHDVAFDNLALTPEPAGLALVAFGAVAVLRRRR